MRLLCVIPALNNGQICSKPEKKTMKTSYNPLIHIYESENFNKKFI